MSIILWIWSVTLWGLSVIPWVFLVSITVAIAGFLYFMYPAWDSKKKNNNDLPNKPRHEKWFYVWLIGLSILGGLWALFLPLALNQKFDGANADGNQLRLHLLYITGGVLALTTLGETHRKNTLEKHKNDQDHTRQVRAERRSRYTTAIEQLSNEKTSIRLGGVYSLVGLVDEWLADEKTIPNIEERRKEGQVIINSLCAYIRSSFDLAAKAEDLLENKPSKDYKGRIQQFTKDQARLREEQKMRQTILSEIKNRIDTTIQRKDTQQKFPENSWSNFDYDFSHAHLFYPINFIDSYFGASSKFSGVTFSKNADFSGAKFTKGADFSGAKFTGFAGFFGTEFTKNADFSGSADFYGSANFIGAEFTGVANFIGAEFTGLANFSWVEFTKGTDFSWAKFTRFANFSWVEFTKGTDFSGAKFTGFANFSEATFEEKPIFEDMLNNQTFKAQFSNKIEPGSYNFEVSHDSPYKIETEEQEFNGRKFTVPKGAILFDPDRPPKLDDNDDS